MDTLLMLGDSLVEWGDWEVLLPEYRVINRGFAGEDVEGLSVRLTEELMAVKAPEHILLMAGTNNLLMGNLFFPAIFSTMLLRLKQLCTESTVTVNAIFPMAIHGLSNESITRVNQELEQVTRDTGCRFLPIESACATHCLPITKPCFLDDGVHLSTLGYQVWAGEIKDHLQSL